MATRNDEGSLVLPVDGAPATVTRDDGKEIPNPAVTALRMEREQFDGKPETAVSVITSSRNLVAIGAMLEEAEGYIGKAAAAITSEAEDGADLEVIKESRPPAPMKVSGPSTIELLKKTHVESKRLVWKAISTSQGRRSMSPIIRDAMIGLMGEAGITVSAGEQMPPREEVLASCSWTVPIFDGVPSVQPNFDCIGVVSKALAQRLQQLIRGTQESRLVLWVNSIDLIYLRTIGWVAMVSKG